VWSPEHSHIPLSREVGLPSGGELPKKYYDAMDPFVALMARPRSRDAHGRHRHCLITQRDTIQTAK